MLTVPLHAWEILRQRAWTLHFTMLSVEVEYSISGEYCLHMYTNTCRVFVDTNINSITIRRRLVDDEFRRSDAT